jgi:ubiquinone/menaquinone biosynthesis C-methylase UbiE
MQIPNFLTEEGSILYSNTIGKLISPRIAEIVINKAASEFQADTKRILDVACGVGAVSLNLANQFPDKQIVGIDFSDAMVAQCQKEAEEKGLKNTEFLEMNANTINFPSQSFDFVVCNLAFPFFSKPTESMSGIFNVLKQNGSIVVSVPGEETWKEFFEVAEEALGDSFQFAKPFLVKFHQASALPETMEEVGFAEMELTSHRIPFTFANGKEVLAFFQELFSMLSYAPDEIRNDIIDVIDKKFPGGFTMHYETIVVHAIRP